MGPALAPRHGRREPLRLENGQRMWVKREYDRGTPRRLRLTDKPLDQAGVTAVDPIEIADRHGAASQSRGQMVEQTQELHRQSIPLKFPPGLESRPGGCYYARCRDLRPLAASTAKEPSLENDCRCCRPFSRCSRTRCAAAPAKHRELL